MNGAQRNLAWKLNWWRQSELEGALLLGRMIGAADSVQLCQRLTRHCAEEAEHSHIWAMVIEELDLPHIQIRRSFQSFFLRHAGLPTTLLEVLAFTQVFERRVHRRFHEELRAKDLPDAAFAAYARMIEDEKVHLAWVAEWLRDQEGASEQLARFERADRLVIAELQPWEHELWEIPGLGNATREEVAA